MKRIPLNKADYYETFPAYLEGISQKFGEKPAITYFTRQKEPVTASYAQLAEQALSAAHALQARGYAGKHLAIVAENCYDWLLAYLAAASAGAVAVCIDVEQSDENIRQMIDQADAAGVFASQTYLSICAQGPDGQSPSGWALFMLGEAEAGREGIQDLCREGRLLMAEKPSRIQDLAADPAAAAAIVYTSGTTSLSKPVMLSHRAVLYNASDAIRDVNAGPRVFSALPFYHSYGMTGAVLDTLVRGAELCINGDLKTMMRDLHLSQPDSMITVPLVVEMLYKQLWLTAEKEGKAQQLRSLLKLCRALKKLHLPWENKILAEIREKMVGSLRVIVCGGAHLEKKICEDFELFGILILQGYGITECAPMVSANGNKYCKMGSVGPVMDHYQVKIVEDEIWVKGISLMNGYYKQPEATKEALSEDGWFKTGDLGYLDKDGFLYITGRKKNLIVFKNGKKVSPEKMEEQLRQIPMVKEVMVYGAANGSSADTVVVAASIYPDPELSMGMSSYEILEHLQAQVDQINTALPLFQQIQMINIRDKEFDKTASKKFKRHTV
ncbi:MAG: AMP-binding protein [Oscillospiraceae bacterium]|nr:AMP-binding protein [Oscillospiraceae bacterium]